MDCCVWLIFDLGYLNFDDTKVGLLTWLGITLLWVRIIEFWDSIPDYFSLIPTPNSSEMLARFPSIELMSKFLKG